MLQCAQMTIATSMIFFHRHYTINALTNTDPFMVAHAACFLAGKVEDTYVYL